MSPECSLATTSLMSKMHLSFRTCSTGCAGRSPADKCRTSIKLHLSMLHHPNPKCLASLLSASPNVSMSSLPGPKNNPKPTAKPPDLHPSALSSAMLVNKVAPAVVSSVPVFSSESGRTPVVADAEAQSTKGHTGHALVTPQNANPQVGKQEFGNGRL